MKFIKNKGFTLIELLVTIAVLSILVLLGAPRLTSYVQEAQLTRIQHDVKVMEQEMDLVLLENEGLEGFDYNAKDLGLLIEANRLFEKEGHAESLEYVPAEGEINGLANKANNKSAQANTNELGVGGVEYELGVGGNEIEIEEEKEFKEIYERYKIIPENYKDKIKTRLKGTFYTNEKGKVYYEPDKPNRIKSEPKVLNCDVALPDYDFEHETGKIIKWHGTEQHLVIPSHFLVDGKCWPVRIIGEGAFMQGGFKSIMIPPSVLVIEGNAFKDNPANSVHIPGSVREIHPGAFDGFDEVIYFGGSPSRLNGGSGGGTYYTSTGGRGSITYRYPSAGEAGLVFYPSTGTVVKGSSYGGVGYVPEYISVNEKNVKVTKVAKGAYQGLGLISVVLPETLEIIEDYAFSGNQLIGVTIPNSVYHIGHYAFSFNEVWHEDNQNDRKATIKTVLLKEEEQFEKINKVGDIEEHGLKVNRFISENKELGPDINLLNHIWVTSIGNIVIDVKYGPVGSGDEVIPDGYEMAELEDFEFVPNYSAPNEYHGNRGYYRYVGDKEYVVIPHIIQDVEIKDYYRMFEGSNVKGVASDNKNVTDMSYMFRRFQGKELELEHLETKYVNDMSYMFAGYYDYGHRYSQLESVDFSSFNTENVTNMSNMFQHTKINSLDLTSFDVSNVTNMSNMFAYGEGNSIDLSSFDMSNVTEKRAMFGYSTYKIGYAKTIEDAGILNNTSSKPSSLNFIVK